MNNYHFATQALHTRYVKEDVHGSLRMPVYDSAAFEFDEQTQKEMGIRPSMLRLSIGIEEVEDLVNDIESALIGT